MAILKLRYSQENFRIEGNITEALESWVRAVTGQN